MNRNETREKITLFIKDTFFAGKRSVKLDDKESFLAGGIVDSAGVLELVAFIEKEFHVTMADTELTPDNLDSIENIVNYIEAKTK